MNKREFLKTSVIAGTGLLAAKTISANENNFRNNSNPEKRHWVWENPDNKEIEEELKKKYNSYYDAGVRGMFFESDSERHFRAAKKAGLEAHRWMWTMNRGEKIGRAHV